MFLMENDHYSFVTIFFFGKLKSELNYSSWNLFNCQYLNMLEKQIPYHIKLHLKKEKSTGKKAKLL